MDRLMHNKKSQIRRARRVRASLSGSAGRPRLSIHLSNLNITAQIIDDAKDSTLVYVSTVGRKLDGNMTQKAALVGEEIATAAKAAKIKKVVFDRGSKRYHGRIKTLADAARAKGLEF